MLAFGDADSGPERQHARMPALLADACRRCHLAARLCLLPDARIRRHRQPPRHRSPHRCPPRRPRPGTHPAHRSYLARRHYVAWTVDGPRGSELHLTGIAPAGLRPGRRTGNALSPPTPSATSPTAARAPAPPPTPPGPLTANSSPSSPTAQAAATDTVQTSDAGQPLRLDPGRQWNEADQPSARRRSATLQWSPDGKSIAFLYVENATRPAGATGRHEALVRRHRRRRHRGPARLRRRRGRRQRSSGLRPKISTSTSSPGPPTRRRSPTSPLTPPGENNWWVAQLYIRSIVMPAARTIRGSAHDDDMTAPISVLDPATIPGPLHGLQIAVPRFSPDGKHIAFIGGLMSDQGSIGGDIYSSPPPAATPPRTSPPTAPPPPPGSTGSTTTPSASPSMSAAARHLTALDRPHRQGRSTDQPDPPRHHHLRLRTS